MPLNNVDNGVAIEGLRDILTKTINGSYMDNEARVEKLMTELTTTIYPLQINTKGDIVPVKVNINKGHRVYVECLLLAGYNNEYVVEAVLKDVSVDYAHDTLCK